MTWMAAPAGVKRAFVVAAFDNFVDTYPLHGGSYYNLISFLPPLHVPVLEYMCAPVCTLSSLYSRHLNSA